MVCIRCSNFSSVDGITKSTTGIMQAKRVTRGSSSKLFAGTPSDFTSSDLPTWRQVIRYLYYIKKNSPGRKPSFYKKMICEKVSQIWMLANSEIPLISESGCYIKVSRLVDDIESIKKKRFTTSKLDSMTSKLDKLFDISSCSCQLDQVPCTHPRIQCKVLKCKQLHILCTCRAECNIPLIERQFLKDQREKTGPKGSFQIGSIDRSFSNITEEQPLASETSESCDTSFESESTLEEVSTFFVNEQPLNFA